MLAAVRTGILGGTFDPIHVAHLHAGDTALRQAGLDRVLFMPAGDPWQKQGRWVSPSRHRLHMTKVATDGVDGFEVDERELVRDGPTFTVETLATFPEAEELFLILGADSAARIRSWQRWEEVVARARVVVIPRPGATTGEVLSVLPDALVLDAPPLEISSTAIRTLVAQGGAYRYLVTEPVYSYIEEHGLYTQAVEDDMVGRSTDQEEAS